MIIFAADSSTGAGSAAILKDGVLIAESYADIGLTHSETLMPLCDEVFRRAGLLPAAVDYYAVTHGPGSFTGLRIGIGIIKGLAFAAAKPCVPISTLEALAWNLPETSRTVVAVCDARNGRVYHAAFRCDNGIQRLEDDRVVPIEELSKLHENTGILLVGDAAHLCYNKLNSAIDCRVAPAHCKQPRAGAVAAAAQRAVAAGRTVAAEDLVPNYIQLSQAERLREEKETI